MPPKLSQVPFIKNTETFDTREGDLPMHIRLKIANLHHQGVHVVVHSHNLGHFADQIGYRHTSNTG
ncbi:hypothetical protein B2G63_31030 [Pseudomonas aeruginosa]|nr:hypothetical protein B2G63_31030 [Pseudomonas aeruginosa]